MSSYLFTKQHPWRFLRKAVAASDTAITTFDYASFPTSLTDLDTQVGVGKTVENSMNAVVIAAYGTDAANEDVGYKLYGRRLANGPIMLLATGVMTLGSQVVTKDPITRATRTAYWVGTITVTGGLYEDRITIRDSGNNRICTMEFDTYGIKDFYLEIDLAAGASDMAEFNAIITGA